MNQTKFKIGLPRLILETPVKTGNLKAVGYATLWDEACTEQIAAVSSPEKAALIARACNAHDALVNALEKLTDTLRRIPNFDSVNGYSEAVNALKLATHI